MRQVDQLVTDFEKDGARLSDIETLVGQAEEEKLLSLLAVESSITTENEANLFLNLLDELQERAFCFLKPTEFGSQCLTHQQHVRAKIVFTRAGAQLVRSLHAVDNIDNHSAALAVQQLLESDFRRAVQRTHPSNTPSQLIVHFEGCTTASHEKL